MKKAVFMIVFISFLFVLIGCTGNDTNQNHQEDTLIQFTLESLLQYDGRDGKEAYIAVDGYVYDVTQSSRWSNGNHNGYQAGQDLTDMIHSSPHGKSVLDNIPKIGILVDEIVD